jgi:hypothetical protein
MDHGIRRGLEISVTISFMIALLLASELNTDGRVEWRGLQSPEYSPSSSTQMPSDYYTQCLDNLQSKFEYSFTIPKHDQSRAIDSFLC